MSCFPKLQTKNDIPPVGLLFMSRHSPAHCVRHFLRQDGYKRMFLRISGEFIRFRSTRIPETERAEGNNMEDIRLANGPCKRDVVVTGCQTETLFVISPL